MPRSLSAAPTSRLIAAFVTSESGTVSATVTREAVPYTRRACGSDFSDEGQGESG